MPSHTLTSAVVPAQAATAGTTHHAAQTVSGAPRVREGHAIPPAPRFALGRVLVTPGALRALDDAEQLRGHGARRSGPDGLPARSLATELLTRHLAGDWGDLDAADRRANEDALVTDARILSAYVLPSGVRLWIITEADRTSTVMCIPPASGLDSLR